jgi:hypothetical protein
MTGCVAAGFGGGFAIDLPVIGTLVGTLGGAALAAFVLASKTTRLTSTHPTTLREEKIQGDQIRRTPEIDCRATGHAVKQGPELIRCAGNVWGARRYDRPSRRYCATNPQKPSGH